MWVSLKECLTHMRDITHSHLRHDSFLREAWLISPWHMTNNVPVWSWYPRQLAHHSSRKKWCTCTTRVSIMFSLSHTQLPNVSKETYKRDLQKRPTKEIYKRDLQKRPTYIKERPMTIKKGSIYITRKPTYPHTRNDITHTHTRALTSTPPQNAHTYTYTCTRTHPHTWWHHSHTH